MDERVLAYAQRHPERLMLLGWTPALIYLVITMVQGAIREPWMALFYVPILVMAFALVWAMSRLTKLMHDLDDR